MLDGRIGLGTAQLAFKDVPFADAVATVRAAVDAGVRLIDTALAYTRPGYESFAEAAVAAALAGRQPSVTVATKGGHRRVADDFPIDATPAALRADCEASLRNLKVDAIDLYQLHHVDPYVPLVESVGALLDLAGEGKIRQIGLSNVTIHQIEVARSVAPVASVQNRFSITWRRDRPALEYCRSVGITYFAYMPLGGGAGAPPLEVRMSLERIAQGHGVSPQQVQLAWVIAQGPGVVPLVGSSRPGSITDSVAAARLSIPADEMRLLDALTPG
jgi:aryl-alcohol dehydrogenase-like predicted oxidoreductase